MTSHATVTSVPLVTHQQCLTSHHDDDCMADAQLKNLSQEIHRRPGRPWQDVVNRSFCNPFHSSLLIQQECDASQLSEADLPKMIVSTGALQQTDHQHQHAARTTHEAVSPA